MSRSMPYPRDAEGLREEVRRQYEVLESIDPTSGNARVDRGIALWHLGELLYRLKRFGDSADHFDEAGELLWSRRHATGHAVAARLRQAQAYHMLSRDPEAIHVLEMLFAAIGLNYEADIDPIPLAINTWLLLLEESGDRAKTQSACEFVIEQCAPGNTERKRRTIVHAFAIRGRLAFSGEDWSLASTMFDEVIARCSEETSSDFAEEACRASAKQVLILARRGNTHEAIVAGEAFLNNFDLATKPWAAEDVAAVQEEISRLRHE